jgi:hypothetical protein
MTSTTNWEQIPLRIGKAKEDADNQSRVVQGGCDQRQVKVSRRRNKEFKVGIGD